jgi:transcriptional regulator with XRE-family HTH domain
MTPTQRFGQNLRIAREAKGITQRRLAEIMGRFHHNTRPSESVNHDTISRLERGYTKANLDIILDISLALDLDDPSTLLIGVWQDTDTYTLPKKNKEILTNPQSTEYSTGVHEIRAELVDEMWPPFKEIIEGEVTE